MALTLTIDGVDKTDLLRHREAGLDIEKVGPTERMTIDIVDRTDSTATAERVSPGAVIRLLHNADLLMGGPVVRVEDRRLVDDTGTVSRLDVRDWLFLAEQVLIEDRYFPPQGAFTLFDDLITTYLVDKGVTNISAATTGGPVLPALHVVGETLLSVFLQITEQTGYPFRINGDKDCALVEPGSLPGPVTLSASNVRDGLTWAQAELVQANRLFLETGTPEAGAGPVSHSETHAADGTAVIFPVNVIPNRTLVGTIDNASGYAAAATSLALKGLTPGMAIRDYNTLTTTATGHPGTYAITGDVTVADDGTVTVAIAPGLTAALVDGDPMTFSDETGIALSVGGTPTDLDGAVWIWDRVAQAVQKVAGGAPSASTAITVSHQATFPAVLRVWETALVATQTSTGAFDRAVLVDGTIDGSTHTDLAQAAAYARDVLSRRLVPPKVVRCTTFTPGWYPFLSTPISIASRLLSSSYMVDTVRVRDIGIDPDSTTTHLPYELELVEGDALRQSWVDYYRGQNPARGIRWGPIAVDLYASQVALEVLRQPPEFVYASQVALESLRSNAGAFLYASQVALESLGEA